MIVIAATVHIQPEKRAQALTLAHRMMTTSRAEAGCISFTFYADLDDLNKLFLFEEWEDEAALEAHLSTPDMAEYDRLFPEVRAGEWTIYQYEVKEKKRQE